MDFEQLVYKVTEVKLELVIRGLIRELAVLSIRNGDLFSSLGMSTFNSTAFYYTTALSFTNFPRVTHLPPLRCHYAPRHRKLHRKPSCDLSASNASFSVINNDFLPHAHSLQHRQIVASKSPVPGMLWDPAKSPPKWLLLSRHPSNLRRWRRSSERSLRNWQRPESLNCEKRGKGGQIDLWRKRSERPKLRR